MTDVAFEVEECDHALTPAETLKMATEMRRLAQDAQAMDAPEPPKIIIKNGLLDMEAVNAILAREYRRPTQLRWHTRKIWSHIVHCIWMWTVYCIPCGIPNKDCRCEHRYSMAHQGVPIHEVFKNRGEYRHHRSLSVSSDYSLIVSYLTSLESK